MRLLEQQYYIKVFMAFFELIAIFAALLIIRQGRLVIFFLIYLILDLFVLISHCYITSFTIIDSKQLSFWVCVADSFIALVELLVYYYFFTKVLRNRKTVKLMKVFSAFFIGVFLIFLVTKFNFLTDRYQYATEIIGVLEFLLILPFCFQYFYELLNSNSTIDLSYRPSFWIVTGILFYSAISIPYLLIDYAVLGSNYEHKKVLDLVFYYLPLTFNFVFLTKAFLCKRILTT